MDPRKRQTPGRAEVNSEGDFSDESIVRALRAGITGSQRRFFEAHAPRLWRLLYRLTGDYDDAHDLTQEAVLQALRKIDRYDGRGTLAGWIAGIGVNLARDELRKRRRRFERLSSARGESTYNSPADPLVGARVHEALAGLGEQERLVLVMHAVEGYTHEEIGHALGIAAGSSRARLSRARSRLREKLQTLNDEQTP